METRRRITPTPFSRPGSPRRRSVSRRGGLPRRRIATLPGKERKRSCSNDPLASLAETHGEDDLYTLYYSPGAASMAVHWMLIHAGAPFELVKIDLDTKAQRAPEYLKINPSGHVPALIVDGVVRTECAALLMLIAERHPAAKLAPALDRKERGEYLQTMFYLANTLQPAFRNWFYPEEPAGADNRDAAMAQARAKIETIWQRFDERFSDGRSFLVAPSLTAADFLGTMLMRWSRNMPKPATQYPHLAAYLKRMWQMPSLIAVHEREGLTDWLPR